MMFRIIGSVVVLVLVLVTAACAAQQRVQPTEEEGTLLSELLPETLAEFVKRSGADRLLDDAAAEQLQDLDALATDAEVAIELLRPTDYFVVHGPWVFVGAAAPSDDDSPSEEVCTLLVAGTNVLLTDGVEVSSGGELRIGDFIEAGVVLNAGDTPILMESLSAEEVITVGSGQAAIVERDCMKSCSVTCGAGYFSCCWVHDDCAYCYCRPDGASDSKCQGGGPGSTGCSAAAGSMQATDL